jgi:hypothetical protein
MRRSRAVLPGTTISAFICTRDNHPGRSRSLDTHSQPIHITRHGDSNLHLDALLGSFLSSVVFHLSAIPSVHPLLSPSFVRHLALWTQSLRTVLFLFGGLYERHGRHDIHRLLQSYPSIMRPSSRGSIQVCRHSSWVASFPSIRPLRPSFAFCASCIIMVGCKRN